MHVYPTTHWWRGLVFYLAVATAENTPLRALPGDPSTCAPGFFRTSPASVGGAATCRACADAQRGCDTGRRLVLCASDFDTHCVDCPAIVEAGLTYNGRGGDCTSVQCIPGWWQANRSVARCAPCPNGYVCNDGASALACPANCTDTLRGGATTLLQCGGGPMEDFRVQYMFTLADVTALFFEDGMDACAAAAMNAAMLASLGSYGTLEGCVVGAPSMLMGTLTCGIVAPECVATLFHAWLITTLQWNNAQNAIALSKCYEPYNKTLLLGAPVVQRIGPVRQSVSAQHNRPMDAPELVEARRLWGQSHLETLYTYGVSSAVLAAMLVGVIAMGALACVQWRRRVMLQTVWSRVRSYHHSLMMMHRDPKTILKALHAKSTQHHGNHAA